ncbi:hypothetical protein FD09_GL002230 [Schleiferilactobacillus perolens DSM 12744]|uniref:Uncharacterized protein n=1 Tax=Schleiferilactobacillus perolens DSM 12744 TaxID=1423792 RepID=A0A0R1MZ39_9LACO|nr:hypothetical protein FD09_GL002230 [Schleiferilactobacillus perolens DSM 12744]
METTPRRTLPRMWLGVLKTAHFAGFKRRHSVPAPCHRRLRSIVTAYDTNFCPDHLHF